jgi:hypothetical protein
MKFHDDVVSGPISLAPEVIAANDLALVLHRSQQDGAGWLFMSRDTIVQHYKCLVANRGQWI